MRIAIGLKAHSGWAAAVVLGSSRAEIVLVDRRRVELVNQSDIAWAKQPYHAAEDLDTIAAEKLIRDATHSAAKLAFEQVKALLSNLRSSGHDVAACAILKPSP